MEKIIEPISTAVTGYAVDKLVQVAEGAFRTHVIERWTRQRAKKFFEAFCESLLDAGVTDAEIGTTLDELLADKVKSEVVFDAYRAVCLSRSKDLGPRVIAILTAELVLARTTSDRYDDLIFSAAEELLDSELREFSDFAIFNENEVLANLEERPRWLLDGSLEIPMGKETTDSNWIRSNSVPIGPLDLVRDIGNWAPKLKRLGLISDDMRERQWRYEEDSEQHVDMPGIAREITWWLTLTNSSLALAKLVQRAKAGREI